MFGCRVAGTCGSAEKEAMLRRLGCDVVVNYNECQDVEAALRNEFPKGW
jgi:NADPH-dependent curcumin reductase CurA